jgi:hypothetical protein
MLFIDCETICAFWWTDPVQDALQIFAVYRDHDLKHDQPISHALQIFAVYRDHDLKHDQTISPHATAHHAHRVQRLELHLDACTFVLDIYCAKLWSHGCETCVTCHMIRNFDHMVAHKLSKKWGARHVNSAHALTWFEQFEFSDYLDSAFNHDTEPHGL